MIHISVCITLPFSLITHKNNLGFDNTPRQVVGWGWRGGRASLFRIILEDVHLRHKLLLEGSYMIKRGNICVTGTIRNNTRKRGSSCILYFYFTSIALFLAQEV